MRRSQRRRRTLEAGRGRDRVVFVRVIGLSMPFFAVKGRGGSERPNSNFSLGVPTTAARRRHTDRARSPCD